MPSLHCSSFLTSSSSCQKWRLQGLQSKGERRQFQYVSISAKRKGLVSVVSRLPLVPHQVSELTFDLSLNANNSLGPRPRAKAPTLLNSYIWRRHFTLSRESSRNKARIPIYIYFNSTTVDLYLFIVWIIRP